MHLLEQRYAGVLDPGELRLAEALRELGERVAASDSDDPAWDHVRGWLAGLGYPSTVAAGESGRRNGPAVPGAGE